MTRTRALRPTRLLLAAALATGGVLLPTATAHAATEPVSVSVKGGLNNAYALGSATGTVTGTRGDLSVAYSIQLCGQSTYPRAGLTLVAGTATAAFTVSPGVCQTFSGTLTSTTGVQSVGVTVTGATFVSQSQHQWYTSSRTIGLRAATTPTPTPTPSPTPVTRTTTLSVTGQGRPLGTATATLTATRGSTQATYSVELCGQSTYPSSSVTLTAGTGSAFLSVSPGVCQTFTGTITSSTGIQTATVALQGATFTPEYKTFSTSRSVSF